MLCLHGDAVALVLNKCYAADVARFLQANARADNAGSGAQPPASTWRAWAAGTCAPALLQAVMRCECRGRRDLYAVFVHEVGVRVNSGGALRRAVQRSMLCTLGGVRPGFVHIWSADGSEVVRTLLSTVDKAEAARCLLVCIERADRVGVRCLLDCLEDRLCTEERVFIACEARSHAVRASAVGLLRARETRLQIDSMVQDALHMPIC